MTLKEAVGKVLEGWTLPNAVRKILEEAYFAEPQPKEPEQEPVGEVVDTIDGAFKCEFTKMLTAGDKLYTTPPQRTWVGLTDKEMREAMNSWSYSQLAMTHAEWVYAVQRATEAKLKEKNT